MATGDLCTPAEYRVARRISDGLDDTEIVRCITVASRWLAAETGRQLWQATGTSTRVYAPPVLSDVILVDDISTLTGLVVVDNGATVAIDIDFFATPANGLGPGGESVPWYRLTRMNGIPWTYVNNGLTISVTARWGWPGGTQEIAKQACFEVVADLLKTADNSFGVIGLDSAAVVRLRGNTHVAALIGTTRRGDRAPGLAIA